jgi:hypothetical protein
MPSSTVAWVREGGIVESVYIHEGSLKDVGHYLLETVNQSNIAEFMSHGDRHNIIDTDEELEESELHKSLPHFFESSSSDFFFILNRVGFWEVASGEDKVLNNLENVLSQVSSENEFTTGCNLDIEQLKAEIIDELLEILPEVILDKFDERMFNIFGIKPPTRH